MDRRANRGVIFKIVKTAGGLGVKTNTVKKQALGFGIGCSDRRLRELAEDGKVKGYWLNTDGKRDSQKTWFARQGKARQGR